MEKKNNCVKVGFSRILWTVSAILLCAAPSLRADETVPAGQTWDIDYNVTGSDPSGFLWVYGIANILPDIDSTQSLVLYANAYDHVAIEASCQRIIQWCRNGTVRVTIIASFDKASLTDAVPDDGQVALEVVGQLNSGQDFYGTDNVRIVSRYWWRR